MSVYLFCRYDAVKDNITNVDVQLMYNSIKKRRYQLLSSSDIFNVATETRIDLLNNREAILSFAPISRTHKHYYIRDIQTLINGWNGKISSFTPADKYISP